MTSLLRELVSPPMVQPASRIKTSRPASARALAAARPTTPAPATTHSTSAIKLRVHDTPPRARMILSAPYVSVHAYTPWSTSMPRDTVYSACPHDCASTCALQIERLGPDRIGRVRGSRRNGYTAGVVCEKVARYAGRVHHADRLTEPLLRVGHKGVGRSAFKPIP